MQMTQKQLILNYLESYGEMIPAKMGGKLYLDQMFGSETSKRCRELRKAGVLSSVGEGKFTKFYLKPLPEPYKPVNLRQEILL